MSMHSVSGIVRADEITNMSRAQTTSITFDDALTNAKAFDSSISHETDLYAIFFAGLQKASSSPLDITFSILLPTYNDTHNRSRSKCLWRTRGKTSKLTKFPRGSRVNPISCCPGQTPSSPTRNSSLGRPLWR